jgi:fructoselysine 6-kinase
VTHYVSIGDNTVDRYLEPIGRELVGGSCANVAVGLAAAGIQVAYLGAVGDDQAGSRIIAELAAHKVDVSHVAALAGLATAVTEIELLENGDRRFASEAYEIFDRYEPDGLAWSTVTSATHVHTSRLPHILERLRKRAGGGAFRLSVDFSTWSPPVDSAGVDLAFLSLDASTPMEEAVELALLARERGALSAVVTLADAGSVAVTSEGTVTCLAVPVEVVDSCGAGDAFIAAYLERWSAGAATDECLAAGALAGAEACRTVGAFPQLLTEGVR